jgi:5'-3' exonuclease
MQKEERSNLTAKNVFTIQAPDDTDAFVVKTAVELSEFHEVTVLAEDTDMLVLLLYHVDKFRII